MAGTLAGLVPPGVASAAAGTTAGSGGHGAPGLAGGDAGRPAARAAEFSVSQPSAGQDRVRTAETTSDPTDPALASRQSTGAFRALTSLHRSPGMPISTTAFVT